MCLSQLLSALLFEKIFSLNLELASLPKLVAYFYLQVLGFQMLVAVFSSHVVSMLITIYSTPLTWTFEVTEIESLILL